jgi:tRNA pseudouridine55 synthase
MFGLLNINKSIGPTSHDVVAACRRLLPRKTRVGHAGTLDPFASGVLVVCVGSATRLADDVADADKQYIAQVSFGATSTTDDLEGEITPTGSPPPAPADLQRAASALVGRIQQTPPAYSAVHVAGQRAYKLARAGKPVELTARSVEVHAIELLEFAGSTARLRIDCGKGVYIRALARDLGRALGCGAYCSALTRTRIGHFTLDAAVNLNDLSPQNLPTHLLPARLAVADWPHVELGAALVAELQLGRPIPAPAPLDGGSGVAAVDAAGRLIALCDFDMGTSLLRPRRVFPLE